MACYHPIPALQGDGGAVRLWPPLGSASMQIPCGTCLGCRSDRATEWARRCVHESKEWRYNSFVTLTYSDECLPSDGNLVPADLQLFLKRLRESMTRNVALLSDAPNRVRFFACGEYGSSTARPHYHVLLFNCGFSDKVRVGKDLYESRSLSALWRFGAHRLGVVTGAAANYVAKYSLKPMDFPVADCDGVERVKPFLRMSRNPGIGARWLETYAADLRGGFLVTEGRKGRIPRAYLKRLEKENVTLHEEVKEALAGIRRAFDVERVSDAEKIHEQRFKRSKRSL